MRLLNAILILQILSENWKYHTSQNAPEFDQTPCVDNWGCNRLQKQSGFQCSVCAEDKSGKRRCLKTFLVKEWFIDQCAIAPKCEMACAFGGKCVSERKRFVQTCFCSNGYYGETCQVVAKPGEVGLRMLQWQRGNAFIKPGVITRFYYRSVVNRDIMKTGVYRMFITGLGHTKNLGEEGKKGMSSPSECLGDEGVLCTSDYVDLQFPFLLPDNSLGITVLKIKDKLKGYISYIKGKFKSENINRYTSYEYNVFVDYEKVPVLKCIPIIRLNNCARIFTKASNFSFNRNQFVSINHNVKYLEDGAHLSTAKEDLRCAAKGTTWIWTWSKYYVKYGFQAEGVEETEIGAYRKFNPFTLDFGIYRINLRIKRVISAGTNENYDECYFKVKPFPLEAAVDGGEFRTVIKGNGIILSATRSYDPNQPQDEQDSLMVLWTCECLSKDIPNCENTCKLNKQKPFKWTQVYQAFYVYPNEIQYNALYKFKVTVDSTIRYKDKNIAPQYDYMTIQVANESVKAVTNYFIECIQNCHHENTLTNEILFLKARVFGKGGLSQNVNRSAVYNWSYSENDSDLQPMDSIKLDDLPTGMVAIKEDSFKQGASYAIILTEQNNPGYLAEYTFTTKTAIYEGNCSVNPQSGIKGMSTFDITCDGIEGFIFEFYDKSEEDLAENVLFNGRMLGTSEFVGDLKGARITRGNIVVYVIQKDSGLFIRKDLKVELSPWKLNGEVMEEIKENLTSTVDLEDISSTMNYVSFIPEIIPEWADRSKIAVILFEAISQVKFNTIADVKLGASTMLNVLRKFRCTPKIINSLRFDFEVVRKMLNIIKEMARKAMKTVVYRDISQWMPSQETRQLSTVLLECFNAVIECNSKSTVGLNEEKTTLDNLFMMRENALEAEIILDNIKDIISYIQTPGLPPLKLASSDQTFQVWAMGYDEEHPVAEMLARDDSIPFEVPKSFLRAYSKENQFGRDLIFQVALLEKNIFSWSKADIRSKLVSLSVVLKKKGKYLTKIELLSSPINLRIPMEKNLTKTTVKGKALQMDPHLDPEDLEMGVTIHKIYVPPKGFLKIRFLFPPSTESLRVLVMEDFRPDYELITTTKDTQEINSSNTEYPLRHRTVDAHMFLYMGILPGKSVPVNQTATYEFEVTMTLCQVWIESQWSPTGCGVGLTTTFNETVCECTHLSIFAAAFPVPPQSIDPFGDAKLFLTVVDNPLVVGFVIILFIIYLLLLLWGWYKDNGDKYKGKVIVLEDNYPEDAFPYLVAVHTSARYNAGTTAHVGILLLGKDATSRAHILSSKRRKVLKRDSDDWFMIFTPKPLGHVYEIQMWHDNYGSSPDWHCEKIVVYDIRDRTEAIFVVEGWLAMREGEYPEALLMISRNQDVHNLKRMFLDNSILGFRDSHTILGIFVRHPRSEVTRVQRISILMCFTMVAMLCSIMFYVPDDLTSRTDDYHYDIGTREIIVSVETLLITASLTLLVLISFRKSYTVFMIKSRRTTLNYRKDEYSETLALDSPSPQLPYSQEKTFYDNYVRYVSKYLKGSPLVPVSMWEGEKTVKLNKIWYTLAWFSCTVIILGAAYLVMLYGLKLGLVQSKKWLTSLVMAFGEDMFIVGPGRIIFFAILLAIAFQSSFKVDLHAIDLEDVRLARQESELNSLETILIKRSHPMYLPLPVKTRQGKGLPGWSLDVWKGLDEHFAQCLIISGHSILLILLLLWAFIKYIVFRANPQLAIELRRRINSSFLQACMDKLAERRKIWSVIDFMNATCCVVVVSAVIGRLWTSHYHGVNHLKYSFSKTYEGLHGAVNIEHINHIDEVQDFLEVNLFGIQFNTMWYNFGQMTTSENEPEGIQKYWGEDGLHKMLCSPLIRQVRVVPNDCSNVYFERMTNCLLKWSLSQEDKSVYGEHWVPATYFDTTKKDSPWEFRDKKTALWWTNRRFYGSNGDLYDAGGYYTSLGPTLKQAQKTLEELRRNQWQDWYTRACFLTTTVYNVNEHVISQVTVLFEYFVDGSMKNSVMITPVSRNVLLGVWEFLFLLYAFYFLFRAAYLINRMGLMEYLKTVGNVTRIIGVFLLFLATGIWCIHHHTSIQYAENYMKQMENIYFDFDEFVGIFSILKFVLSLLLCIAIIRAFTLLRGGRRFVDTYYAIILSLRECWLSLGILLLIFILMRLQYFLHCQEYFRMKELVLPLRFTVLLRTALFEHINIKVFVLLRVVVMYYMRSILVGLFGYYIMVAKAYKFRESDNFNFVSFIVERVKKCFNRSKI